ncbi:DUF5916 domain-containing protein [Cesiribacter andamanensis]|uniref:Uncharacterized protein n=1 Tax=Cesiribacter andamanensis AMV16 TaxID=1279009 RepID=M7N2F9_9BACT|nr:DUF5916 domain-containing protein [Cesiribacter andamanensis]EMR01487.1 hypothetical protein ADICEAN_03372 [Cesiribacter andamanensis AMV16]
MMRFLYTLSIFSLLAGPLLAQEKSATSPQEASIPRKVYTTAPATTPPDIDGLLNDAAWDAVEWGGDFTQREPDKGAPATQKTAFKVLYDAKNLYVAIRAYDTDPEQIVRRMSRRDGFDGDWVEVNIDSYFDHRTAFSFTASVSGVKGDEAISNNGDVWDAGWDPIWYLKTSVDAEGWVAEMRIPLSQLRFANKAVHTWGFQISRLNFREQERSVWQYIPPDAPGWVHLFGELQGLEGIKPQKQLEIQPFVLAKADRYQAQEGNPFASGRDRSLSVGVDGKVGITSDITLDFTINPDFGQVEADPSQVNLSAFQVFFPERRPFFLEGKNILTSPLTESVAGGSFNSDNLFYSRRIGARPHHYPSLQEGEWARVPDNVTILGAVKLTGKNKKGFSWGLLETVTAEERAEIDAAGQRSERTVEPLTNFLVGRFQQDLKEGKTVFGGMITAVNRKIEHQHLEYLHKDAYAGGLDVQHFLKDRKYYIAGNFTLSNVRGTPEAITRTQRASERFFQRPDADHVEVDPTRTALSGTSGTVKFGKTSGDLVMQTGLTWRSPGLALNDAGFLRSSDLLHQWVWAQYRKLQPFSAFRWLRVNANEYLSFDFGGTNTYRAVNVNGHTQFKNFWALSMGSTLEGESISNADLRGGPGIRYPGGLNYWYWLGSDRRKKFSMEFNHYNRWGWEGISRYQEFYSGMSYRPINALNLSLGANLSFNENQQQYVATRQLQGQDRYLTATIDQQTVGLELRFTYILTPDLSLQFWGQPFMSKGHFSQFKQITNPKDAAYSKRFTTFGPDQLFYNRETELYYIDENRDGSTDYQIGNPDFNFVEFRSNMVLRWEYIPGSTLFLVWNQGRSGMLPLNRTYQMNGLSEGLLDVPPHNIFLIKYTYRFVL